MRPPRPFVPPDLGRHEQAVATLAAATPRPVEGECLACFLVRAVRSGGCGGDHALVECFREVRAPAATGVADRLVRRGAPCDCAAVTGTWQVARQHRERDVHTDELVVPDPFPACCGVGPSSARPCSLWQRAARRPPGHVTACRGPGLHQTAVL